MNTVMMIGNLVVVPTTNKDFTGRYDCIFWMKVERCGLVEQDSVFPVAVRAKDAANCKRELSVDTRVYVFGSIDGYGTIIARDVSVLKNNRHRNYWAQVVGLGSGDDE